MIIMVLNILLSSDLFKIYPIFVFTWSWKLLHADWLKSVWQTLLRQKPNVSKRCLIAFASACLVIAKYLLVIASECRYWKCSQSYLTAVIGTKFWSVIDVIDKAFLYRKNDIQNIIVSCWLFYVLNKNAFLIFQIQPKNFYLLYLSMTILS